MRPPFEITARAASLVAEIERMLGMHDGALLAPASPLLRRSQRVRTIQASLAIEGNTLTAEQVTAVLEGKRVIAPAKDLREVENAIRCYDQLAKWKPENTKHLLAAHHLMMAGLVSRPGAWRSRGVGIAKGSMIAHIAPPADRVAGLMNSLFGWLKEEKEVPPLICAAVCHYEMEFIHPFEDGNGRMGRLWHSLILFRHHPLFSLVPIESAIRDRQQDYYTVLGLCDKAGKSTLFIEFSLEVTLAALKPVFTTPQPRMSGMERISAANGLMGSASFLRKEYMSHFPGLSAATASRDLQMAVESGILKKTGDKAMARYKFSFPGAK
ncbi:Fic family protein [Prosthecobacter fusiformis]|uniref:Fic family protein n=1 Tax=Prosthecobacter fusiformis TaxID=48464 RepID=A0A4R7SNK5_9BACT|nr:Fic family protein [Prosthecobacter fusiformis]TDU80752.1 Fic family protein [Prosthecobacter fusiformis]